MDEKRERNEKIYCLKKGLASITAKKPTSKPLTYRELTKKYRLSTTRLQLIVRRMERRFK